MSKFCAKCGREFALDARFCSGCGAQVTGEMNGFATQPRLVRPRSPRMLAGVCSGIAIYYGWDVALVRILFAVLVCASVGVCVVVYLAAWVLIPDAQYALPAATQRQGNVV